MNQDQINMELLSFDEKISLAKLEVSKAQNRVRELQFQKCRFILDVNMQILKEKDKAIKNG